MNALLKRIDRSAATLTNLLAECEDDPNFIRQPYTSNEYRQALYPGVRMEEICANCANSYCPLPWTDHYSAIGEPVLYYGHTVVHFGKRREPNYIWPICSLFCEYCFEIRVENYTRKREKEWLKLKQARLLLEKTQAYLKQQRGNPQAQQSPATASRPATTSPA